MPCGQSAGRPHSGEAQVTPVCSAPGAHSLVMSDMSEGVLTHARAGCGTGPYADAQVKNTREFCSGLPPMSKPSPVPARTSLCLGADVAMRVRCVR